MTDHFKGRYEVELKYRLTSRAQFLSRLKAMNPEIMLEDNLEHDSYFDLPGGELKGENKSVCIRNMQPSGIKLWIVKGPEADRCEAVNITDDEKACSMLQTMGFKRVLEMKKTRSIYFLGEFHATLDHLEGIGDFAELAIMTDDEHRLEKYREQLLELAATLGLDSTQLETRSYRELQANSNSHSD
ncbi:putative adenylate cyclase CyaB [Shewanella sediminis HAW-EB3]|uniref:Putative adenylate cyclase CyaB n=1 Tax=Shewanella sediminis (strain HAW-EB3) TaxID=425104 RepID=A8FS38_SHESH|nr:class IV adenylate cyclase [Shewanella sediminis]ABV35661.1 putative adenylate cyclase CyaB [Shewanella sediminis HAW-EB3]